MQNAGDITMAKSLSFDTLSNVRIYEGDRDKSETLAPALRGADKDGLQNGKSTIYDLMFRNKIRINDHS